MLYFFRFILLIFFSVPLSVLGQFILYNSEQFWEKFPLHKMGEERPLSSKDTAIIVVSNRVMDTVSFRYLPERRDVNKIRYFVVYALDGKWHVQPFGSLKAAIDQLPVKDKSWVVYTEGMGKFFTSDAERGMNMAARYDVNVIMFDYPSITAHKKHLGNYFFAKANAGMAHMDFAPVMDSLRVLQQAGYLGTKGINLFFHSMGNIMLRQLVRKGKLKQLNQGKWVQNLVLNAPCIPQLGHRKLLDKITFAERVYLNYNPADYTLGGAYLVSKRYQLGKQIRKPLSENVVYINFNPVVGAGHSYFLSLADRHTIPISAYRHYQHLFQGKSINVNDTLLYRPSEYRCIGYDILP